MVRLLPKAGVQRRVFPESSKREAVGRGPQSLETACIAMKSKGGLGKRPEDANQERIWACSPYVPQGPISKGPPESDPLKSAIKPTG